MPAESLFDRIAPCYDRMNRLLSLGLDRGWRRQAVSELAAIRPRRILDLACGSGELALAALRLQPEKVVAVDPSPAMLALAAAKVAARGQSGRVELLAAAAESLPFADGSFDAVTIGFGVRNFAGLEPALRQVRRVLRPGGMVVILEFSRPRRFPARQLHRLYVKRVIPAAGALLAADRAAYRHLADSLLAFADGAVFAALLQGCGFASVSCRCLLFGACSIYAARA